mgnify:FL=1
MSKGIILKNNITKETLLKIAELGIFTVAAASSPYFLNKIIKKYFKNKIEQRSRKLRELQKRKLINIEEYENGIVKITLSHLGKNLIRQYKLEEMEIKKPLKWDGQWRIIIYDIPQKLRKASNAFRRKIKGLGLYRLQKSIWVSPYDCISELEFLCAIFGIPLENCVYYFKTKELPKEADIKKFFDL